MDRAVIRIFGLSVAVRIAVYVPVAPSALHEFNAPIFQPALVGAITLNGLRVTEAGGGEAGTIHFVSTQPCDHRFRPLL